MVIIMAEGEIHNVPPAEGPELKLRFGRDHRWLFGVRSVELTGAARRHGRKMANEYDLFRPAD